MAEKEERLAEIVNQAMRVVTAPLVTRIGELERQVVALEQRSEKGVCYGGVHEDGRTYREGTLVTRGGGLWIAEHDTTGVPGAARSGFRLIVKSGTAG